MIDVQVIPANPRSKQILLLPVRVLILCRHPRIPNQLPHQTPTIPVSQLSSTIAILGAS